MMDVQLTTWLIFSRAIDHFPHVEVVSRRADGSIHRQTYGEMAVRAQQLMHALDALGVPAGARIGTLAWNGYRHLEAYFAVPCSRRVLHTLNIRLSAEELAYVINHAADEVLLVDAEFLPVVAQIRDRLTSVRHVVVLGPEVVDAGIDGLLAYEELIAGRPGVYPRPEIDEREVMGLCYTSGTTGRSKGVPYTHRSTLLNVMGVTSMGGMAFGPQDCVLAIVPMFHAAAWGMPYAATSVGAKQAFFAGPFDPEVALQFIADEEVTVAAGVPSVWLTMSDAARAHPERLRTMRHIISGGSQPPPALMSMYEHEFKVPIIQAWGMTETSPLAAAAWPQHAMRHSSTADVERRVRTQAGVPLLGVEVKLEDDNGQPVPFDGVTMGNLFVRGPWVTDHYERDESPESFVDGWFRTGDVAVGSPDGYFTIADRTKDLIKSGGEWISSVAMEASIMAMPSVREAVVVGVPDPKWQERPLPCVVLEDGQQVSIAQIREHLEADGFARWQLPDTYVAIGEIPKTAVGKADKKVLRAQYSGDDGIGRSTSSANATHTAKEQS